MDDWFPTFRRFFETRSWLAFGWPRRATLPQRLALLRLIAVATVERLALSPLLEAWAADQRGPQRHRVHRLAQLLKAGTPLSDAVEQVPRALGDEDVLAIRFGAQSGILAPSVRHSIDRLSTELENPRPTVRGVLLYGAVIGFIFLLISVFYYVKIIPALLDITQNFKIGQPRSLRASVDFGNMVASFWWVGALLLLALIWAIISPRAGQFFRDLILGRLFRSSRKLRFADVLEKLGLAAKSGRPAPAALSTLARYHFDPLIRHKLLYARNEVEQGADAWQTLAAAGLLTPAEERLLATADRAGNRAWALAKIAHKKRRQTYRRMQTLSDLMLPAVVLVLGSYVLFQALSLFVPLVKFISRNL
jgi:type II secretory pathway component PulF